MSMQQSQSQTSVGLQSRPSIGLQSHPSIELQSQLSLGLQSQPSIRQQSQPSFCKNTFIHIDLHDDDSGRTLRRKSLPLDFVLSDSPKETPAHAAVGDDSSPRLSHLALTKLAHAKASLKSLSVESQISALSLGDSYSDNHSDHSESDSDFDARVLSPSGRQERMHRYVNENAEKTTLMIRNIPCRMSQNELLEEVEMVVPGVNFLYLPQSRKRDGNVGYAFVNFTAPHLAVRLIRDFQGREFPNHPMSSKRADVGYATLQGFKENVRFYRRSKVSKSENRPYINYN
jgi:hypothetical protein